MTDLDQFLENRPLLLSAAYRLLGRYAEAEEIVQESYISWTTRTPGEIIHSPKAFLTTIVVRLCLDRLKSAARKREEYPGLWLPEPVETNQILDPAHLNEHAETISYAFLLLLDRLPVAERAVFILRDIFDFDYAEIARMIEKTEENCRQLNARARKHVREERKEKIPEEQKRKLLAGFIEATTRGNLDSIVQLLTADVRLCTDGGGKVNAARNIIYGPLNIGRFFVGIRSKRPGNLSVRLTDINGGPGIVVFAGNRIYSVVSLDYADGRIQSIYSVMNPDKFGAFRGARPPGPFRRIFTWLRLWSSARA